MPGRVGHQRGLDRLRTFHRIILGSLAAKNLFQRRNLLDTPEDGAVPSGTQQRLIRFPALVVPCVHGKPGLVRCQVPEFFGADSGTEAELEGADDAFDRAFRVRAIRGFSAPTVGGPFSPKYA